MGEGVIVPASNAPLLGDPAGLAERQFRFALDLCAECRDYHATWGYRRLSRTLAGIEATATIVGRLLRDAVPRGGRLLVAGAADAGLLALAAHATDGLAPVIDVADRCLTPLAVCRRYAEMHGLSIATHQVDFVSRVPPQRYDAVIADCVLQFVPRALHVDVLRRLREAITANGTLILSERVHRTYEAGPRQRDRAVEIVHALEGQGIRLPEDAASFQLRLIWTLDEQRVRVGQCSTDEDLAALLAKAGYRVRELPEDEREGTVAVRGADAVKLRTIVASPMSI